MFELYYELEANKTLNRYKRKQDGAFYGLDGDKAGKAINQLNIDGSFVASHNSLGDAARAVGNINNKGKISAVVNGKAKSAYGFKWELVNDDINTSLF